jgi:hypothetical protein
MRLRATGNLCLLVVFSAGEKAPFGTVSIGLIGTCKRTNLQLKVRKRFDGFQCCGNIEQGHKRVETKGDLVVYMPLTITRGD